MIDNRAHANAHTYTHALSHHAPAGNASRPGPLGPSREGVLRAGYTCKLVCEPAFKIYSGTGGVILRSGRSGSSSSTSPSAVSSDRPLSSLVALNVLSPAEKLSNELLLVSGLDTAGSEPLRIRLRLRMLVRSEMICPACGAAMTIVPGLAMGGGVGESDRKSGWMWPSLTDVCSVVKARRGGAGRALRVDAGLKLRLRRAARGAAKSSGVPGLGLRLVVGLAGMVSRKRLPPMGDVVSSTSWRFCGSTPDVSQESKLSSVVLVRSRYAKDSIEAARLADRWLRKLRRLR